MSRTLLLVGTRKGLFLLESDADRANWSMRGPFCDGWPVYHAVLDPDSGAIYAAAASEWHGSASGAAPTSARRGRCRARGSLTRMAAGCPRSRASRPLTAACSSVRRRRASSRVATRGRRGLRTRRSTASPAARSGTIRRTSRPATSGSRRSLPHRDDPARFWAIVQGFGIFETTDDGKTWTPRNRGLRADWPLEHEEVGFCVHKLVRSPVDEQRLYQQNHVGMHRSDDAGATWTEITEGLPTEFGFAAAAHPARPRHLLRDPARPGPRPHDARRSSGGLAHEGRGLELAAARRTGSRRRTRTSASCAREWRSTRYDMPGLYFGTSTGQVFASADEGETLERDRELPARDLVGRGRGHRLMADIHLPPTLLPLFADLPRRLDLEAATVDEAIDRLDERWPGIARPAVRPERRAPAAHQRLRRPRAGGARHPARAPLAGRRDRRDQRRLARQRCALVVGENLIAAEQAAFEVKFVPPRLARRVLVDLTRAVLALPSRGRACGGTVKKTSRRPSLCRALPHRAQVRTTRSAAGTL